MLELLSSLSLLKSLAGSEAANAWHHVCHLSLLVSCTAHSNGIPHTIGQSISAQMLTNSVKEGCYVERSTLEVFSRVY